jgi:hypothetical protein
VAVKQRLSRFFAAAAIVSASVPGLSLVGAGSLFAQTVVGPPPSVAGPDSVTIAPGGHYAASATHDFFFGDNYRVFWTTPIRVPVLDLHRFADGLKPRKKGGGMQTESLRFDSKDGEEYAFRTVDKVPHLIAGLKGPLATAIIRDQISSEHPAAALVAAPLLEAAGVLHATPQLVVMPHDSLLGEYSTEFAGRLGVIELAPGKTSHGEGFAGALEIIDSDSLRKLLDSDGSERIDARALLKARLMDLFLNDIDRHPGQWKWARMKKGHGSLWEAIPRDRDQAFVAFHGAFVAVARLAAPNLVRFDGNISIPGLTYNSLEMDRRLLSGLERPVWDSIANDLTARLTDSMIAGAVHAMPVEYGWSEPAFIATLELRRAHLKEAATTFYLYLASVVDVHGTDAADRLVVTRMPEGLVEVRLESTAGDPYFARRFDARETHEIRVYLHGGADTSIVRGNVERSISVKIIGGNGVNWLTDSSRVDDRTRPTDLIDNATVEGVTYGKDTLFQRLPFFAYHGRQLPAGRDRGVQIAPDFRLSSNLTLGIAPKISLTRYAYGFRDRPYSSEVGVTGEYAFGLEGLAVHAYADKRWEGTPFHLLATASVSQLAVLAFHGVGNETPDSASGFFDVRQWQWRFRPAIGYALGETTDLSLGPVFGITRSDSTPGRMLSLNSPYGSGTFAQAGLQLRLHHDIARNAAAPLQRFVFDVDGTYYPAMMDVTAPYEVVTAQFGSFITFPFVTDPVLVWRAGATKVFGAYPFFDAAFIGGSTTLRDLYPDRYAGDAAVFATGELRIPLVSFALMVPMRAGVVGTAGAGRVYVNGASPGGWHTTAGAGVWMGLASQSLIVTCTVTNDFGRKQMHCQTGLGI